MAEHTSGPWVVDDFQIQKDGAIIASVNQGDDFPCVEDDERPALEKECEANARLIAAAPEMLTILDEIRNNYPCDCPDDDLNGECLMCRAIRVIEKATESA